MHVLHPLSEVLEILHTLLHQLLILPQWQLEQSYEQNPDRERGEGGRGREREREREIEREIVIKYNLMES